VTRDTGSFALGGFPVDHPLAIAVRAPGFVVWRQTHHPSALGEGLEITLDPASPGSGRVRDELDQGVPGALVRLETWGDRLLSPEALRLEPRLETHTDEGGAYAFDELPGGSFTLRVEAPGYAPAEVPGLEAEPGGVPTDLGILTLLPGATLTGRVVDSDGQPVAGAEVWAALDQGSLALGRKPSLGTTQTPEDGTFELSDLPLAVRLTLTAAKEGYALAEVRQIDPASAESLRVVLVPAARLAGRVVDSSGNGVGRARLTLLTGETDPWSEYNAPTTSTDEEGRFDLENLESGSVRLLVEASEFLPRVEPMTLEPGKGKEDLLIQIEPGLHLEGQVLDPDRTPISGASVTALGRMELSRNQPGTSTDRDGRFRIGGLGPGSVEILVSAEGYPQETLGWAVRADGPPLEIVLSRGSSLTGRVVDEEGRPVESAEVSYWFQRQGNGPGKITAPDGTFSLTGLPSGRGWLLVSKAGFASISREIEAQGPSLDLGDLSMGPGAVLGGRILGLSLEELSQLRIFASRPGDYSARGEGGRLDAEGRYKIEHLAPGSWTILVALRDRDRTLMKPVEIPPGAPQVELDLDFASGSRLSGRLLRGDDPFPGVTLLASGPVGVATTTSQHDGSYVLEDLSPGPLTIVLMSRNSGLAGEWKVEIGHGSQEMDLRIEVASLAGRVVDSAGSPVADAEVRLLLADGAFADSLRQRGRSDSAGRFDLPHIPRGRYHLEAHKKGYGPARQILSLEAGVATEGLTLVLPRAEGAAFRILPGDTLLPSSVFSTVIDGAGQAVYFGLVAVDGNGWVHLDSVPEGRFTLVVRSEGRGSAVAALEVPGEAPALRLPKEVRLRLRIPELGQALGLVRAWFSDGTPYPFGGPEVFRTAIRGGSVEIGGLPPGLPFTLQVQGLDDRVWRVEVVLGDGPVTEVEITRPPS
jgi:protocatechuate 3,4-dioxygenase beta subunit